MRRCPAWLHVLRGRRSDPPGATVLIAMAGMFVSGNSLFATIGLGTMIVVLAAMVGSLTVLPRRVPVGVQRRLGPGSVLRPRFA